MNENELYFITDGETFAVDIHRIEAINFSRDETHIVLFSGVKMVVQGNYVTQYLEKIVHNASNE